MPYDRDWHRPHYDFRNDVQDIDGHSNLEPVDVRADLDRDVVVQDKWMATDTSLQLPPSPPVEPPTSPLTICGTN